MTVAELIERLSGFQPDMRVCIVRDDWNYFEDVMSAEEIEVAEVPRPLVRPPQKIWVRASQSAAEGHTAVKVVEISVL